MKVAREWLHCTVREAQERLTSIEFSEIIADYCLQKWGDDWEQTAYLASAMAVEKSGKPIKDYRTLIPRVFDFVFITDTNQIDDESVFRRLAGGGRRKTGD